MQFRKTKKNHLRGGSFEAVYEIGSSVLKTIVGVCRSNDQIAQLCEPTFLSAIKNPAVLATAGITASTAVYYLLRGTPKQQHQLVIKVQNAKKKLRQSEESSDSNIHRSSKYDDSSSYDESLYSNSISRPPVIHRSNRVSRHRR